MCISQAKWSVTCRYVIFPVSLSKSWIHFIQDWSASTDWWTGVTWSCSAYGWISSKIKVYMIRFWFWIEEFLYMLPLIPVFLQQIMVIMDYTSDLSFEWRLFRRRSANLFCLLINIGSLASAPHHDSHVKYFKSELNEK